MDTVGDVMTKNVVTCTPTQSIMDVRTLMGKHRISRVVAVDERNGPVGIITQKDIVRFLVTDRTKRGLDEIPVREVMSMDLSTVNPAASIPSAAKAMVKGRMSSLIVVGKDDKLEGIVTKADLSLYLASKGAGIFKVRDCMTPNPLTVRPSQSLLVATSLMSEHEVSRIVVTDDENRPVGIITLADLTMLGGLLKARKLPGRGRPSTAEGDIILPGNIHLIAAQDVMTINPVSIDGDADLAEAARLMTRHAISGIPVRNRAGKLTGIVTKSDITRAVASVKE